MVTTRRRSRRGALLGAALCATTFAFLAAAPATRAAAELAAASPLSLDQEVRQAPVLESLAELRKKGASTNQQIDAIERRLNAIDERFEAISEKMLSLEVVAKGNAEEMNRLEAILSGRLGRIENYLRVGFGLVALICLGIIVTLVTLTREIARRVGPTPVPSRRPRGVPARLEPAPTGAAAVADERLPADAG